MADTPERRTDHVPIEIIKHINCRLDTHAAQVVKYFEDHTRNEMERVEDILEKIELTNRGAELRFRTLSDLVKESVVKTEQTYAVFSEAFPVNRHGKPDFAGHALAHESWIKETNDSRELRAYIQKVVLAAAAIAVGSWVALLIWQAVLHGPVK